MSMLFFLVFAGPIHWFWHPHVIDAHGNCLAEPGSLAAVYCPLKPRHAAKR